MSDDTIHILGEGGGIFELSLPLHETIADKLRKGLIRRVNPDGAPFSESERPGIPGLPTSRPAVNAPKADWVGWAVVESERRGEPISTDDAEAFTKQDLIERYGVNATADEPADGEIPGRDDGAPNPDRVTVDSHDGSDQQ